MSYYFGANVRSVLHSQELFVRRFQPGLQQDVLHFTISKHVTANVLTLLN